MSGQPMDPLRLATLSDDQLGALLRAAQSFPRTPDLAATVVARLPAAQARGPAWKWPRLGRGTVLAFVAIAFVAAVAAAALLGVAGIQIRFVDVVPRPTPSLTPLPGAGAGSSSSPGLPTHPTPSPRPTLPGEGLGLGLPRSLSAIQAAAGQPVALPSDAALGPPDQLYLDTSQPGGMISLVWAARPDLPSAAGSGVGLLISEFDGKLETNAFQKLVDSRVSVERVDLGTGDAWWLSGASHFFVDLTGSAGGQSFEDVRTRLAGDTLLWEQDGLTFRLEGDVGRERALAIAASVQPVFEQGAADVRLEPFVDGLESPVFITGDGTGSGWLYVVEQPGRIWAVSPGGQLAPEPFLNISDRVVAGGERGLLGLAFHPDYPQNGRFFVDYTRAQDGATVISELHAQDGVASAGSERILLVIPQPYANHNGGMLAFDAQGRLLIGMGDGGSGGDPDGNGQDKETLLAKLLRIDVDGRTPYGIPADDPFLRDTDTRPEIFALGLRNPWRFSVDRLTGDIWIGDVGQGDWEEVDVIPAGSGGGQDFGWNITEGPACFGASSCDRSGLTEPVASYDHGSGCTVIGGYVYRGRRWASLVGGYLYGDYCSGRIWLLSAQTGVTTGVATPTLVATLDGSLSSFGQGDDGELYAVDLAGGRILHIVASPAP